MYTIACCLVVGLGLGLELGLGLDLVFGLVFVFSQFSNINIHKKNVKAEI